MGTERLKELVRRYRLADVETESEKQIKAPISGISSGTESITYFTLLEYLEALPEITHHPLYWLCSFVKPREESGLNLYKDVYIKDTIHNVQCLRGEAVVTHNIGDFVWVTTESTFNMKPKICVPTSPKFKNILGHPEINNYGFAFERVGQNNSVREGKKLILNGKMFSVGDSFVVRQEFKARYVWRGDRKEHPVFGIDGFPGNIYCVKT